MLEQKSELVLKEYIQGHEINVANGTIKFEKEGDTKIVAWFISSGQEAAPVQVGYIEVTDEGELDHVEVNEEYQEKGIGKRLVWLAIHDLQLLSEISCVQEHSGKDSDNEEDADNDEGFCLTEAGEALIASCIRYGIVPRSMCQFSGSSFDSVIVQSALSSILGDKTEPYYIGTITTISGEEDETFSFSWEEDVWLEYKESDEKEVERGVAIDDRIIEIRHPLHRITVSVEDRDGEDKEIGFIEVSGEVLQGLDLESDWIDHEIIGETLVRCAIEKFHLTRMDCSNLSAIEAQMLKTCIRKGIITQNMCFYSSQKKNDNILIQQLFESLKSQKRYIQSDLLSMWSHSTNTTTAVRVNKKRKRGEELAKEIQPKSELAKRQKDTPVAVEEKKQNQKEEEKKQVIQVQSLGQNPT